MNIPIAGVYALRHRATGSIYIGSSGDLPARLKKWRTAMNSRNAVLPLRIRALTQSAGDWETRVIFDGSSATMTQVRAAEKAAIEQVTRMAAHRLLNVHDVGPTAGVMVGDRTQSLRSWSEETGIPHQTISYRLRARWTPAQAVGLEPPPEVDDGRDPERERASATEQALVLVFDGDRALTQREAADALGISQDSVRKKLRRFRVEGEKAHIQLDQLRRSPPR